MNKAQLEKASNIALLRQVFGLQPGQTLSQFVAECATVKTDEPFIAEVRAYAIANATE
jgi:hypothetical protein